MSTLHTLLFSCAALAFLGCVQTPGAEPLPIRSIAQGAVSGILEPTEVVIRDKAAWEQRWNKHCATRTPAPLLPKVDFAKEMVVMVTMGRKNSGGYAVEITKVEPAEDKLRIFVQYRTPRPGGVAIQSLTAPFHIVALPINPLPAQFVDTGPASKPPK